MVQRERVRESLPLRAPPHHVPANSHRASAATRSPSSGHEGVRVPRAQSQGHLTIDLQHQIYIRDRDDCVGAYSHHHLARIRPLRGVARVGRGRCWKAVLS